MVHARPIEVGIFHLDQLAKAHAAAQIEIGHAVKRGL